MNSVYPLRYSGLMALVTLLLLGAGWGQERHEVPAEVASEPLPVLMVPGWSDEATTFQQMRERLLGLGWPESYVVALNFSDPVGSNAEHAEEIARAVELLLTVTRAPRVDLVSHSMGGLASRHYLVFGGGDEQIRRAVFLGTPHRGTVAAILSWGDGGREMIPGSDFLSRLNEAGSVPPGIEALAIRTPVDIRVIPSSSAMLPGVPNVEICCPSHIGLLEDERVFREVLTFLRDGFEREERPGHSIPLRTPLGGGPRR